MPHRCLTVTFCFFGLGCAAPLLLRAGDIPGEVQSPCQQFPQICVPPVPGPPGAISLFGGVGSLLSTNTGTVGSLGDPWLIMLQQNSLDAVLNFAGEIPGGPLRSVSGMQNEVGTLHYAGRYFQLTLTNGSNVPWNGIILNIATDLYPDLHGDLDGVSFGLNFGPDPIVNYSSSAFSQVERLPVDFFSDLSFSNGTLLPGQSTTLLFALTDDGYGPFRGPYLGYRLSISAETPEPSTVLLFAIGLAVLLARVTVQRKNRCAASDR